MAAMSYHCDLPEDLIPDILVRLPVKSLLRFRSTCKLWNTIITSPFFNNKYFQHESNCRRLIFCNYGFGTPMDRQPYDKTFEIQVLDTKVSYGYIKNLSGPCNGVFCVTYRDGVGFGLWNPTTRRFKLLPPPPKESSFDDPRVIGFGVDPMTGEFKIVLLYITILDYRLEKVAIYTPSADSWRYLNNGLLPDYKVDISRDNTRSTFSNGFCYWVLYKHTEADAILAFDMHKEVFEVIEMPNVEMPKQSFSSLGLCGNSLALMYISYHHVDPIAIGVSVMEQNGCWTQLYNVVTRMELFDHLRSNFFDEHAGSWILYEDPHSSQKETHLQVASYCGWLHLYLSCRESLALL